MPRDYMALMKFHCKLFDIHLTVDGHEIFTKTGCLVMYQLCYIFISPSPIQWSRPVNGYTPLNTTFEMVTLIELPTFT